MFFAYFRDERDFWVPYKDKMLLLRMTGLLDFIFENIDIENLDRIQVLNHTDYISEISRQNLPLDKKAKFLSVKVRLQQRLIELDKQKVTLNGILMDNYRHRGKL